jgi:hypothetical protein
LRGRTDEARTTIDQALKLSNTNSDPALSLAASIQNARVDSASAAGKTGMVSAQQKLRGVSADARKIGYFNLECEARLVMAELLMRTNTASATAQLSTLAADARSHGFTHIVRRAERILAG